MFKNDICPNSKICTLRKRIDLIEAQVVSELKSVTVETLLKKGGKKWPREK